MNPYQTMTLPAALMLDFLSKVVRDKFLTFITTKAKVFFLKQQEWTKYTVVRYPNITSKVRTL